MNELICVDYENKTVSAREFHKEVGSTERFSVWFERQCSLDLLKMKITQGVKLLTP